MNSYLSLSSLCDKWKTRLPKGKSARDSRQKRKWKRQKAGNYVFKSEKYSSIDWGDEGPFEGKLIQTFLMWNFLVHGRNKFVFISNFHIFSAGFTSEEIFFHRAVTNERSKPLSNQRRNLRALTTTTHNSFNSRPLNLSKAVVRAVFSPLEISNYQKLLPSCTRLELGKWFQYG